MTYHLKMQIRKCTPDDAPLLACIVTDTWQTAYNGILPDNLIDAESLKSRREHLCFYFGRGLGNRWFESFLLTVGNTPAGCFTVCQSKDPDAGADMAELLSIYILAESRYAGHGTKCMNFMTTHLKEQGYKKLAVWMLYNNLSTITFFEKHGFTPDGMTRNVVLGDGLQDHRYVKGL